VETGPATANPFRSKRSLSIGKLMSRTALGGRLRSFDLGAVLVPIDGSLFAIVLSMNNRRATRQRDVTASFVRAMRGFAEASLVALAFGCAILLIGMPIALIVRGVHEGLSWLVGRGGDMSALAQALVSFSSVAGGIVITAALARLLVRGFHWRRRFVLA
jgi:hypothetical protein